MLGAKADLVPQGGVEELCALSGGIYLSAQLTAKALDSAT